MNDLPTAAVDKKHVINRFSVRYIGETTRKEGIFMTNCNIIKDLLPLYADGILSAESAALVGEHLAECAECAELLEKTKTDLISNKKIAENIKAINPFILLKKIRPRIVIIVAAAAIFITVSLMAVFGYMANGWFGVDSMFGINQTWILSGDGYENELLDTVAEGEGWDRDKIKVMPMLGTTGYKYQLPSSGLPEYHFVRPLEYDGEKYMCVFFAKETFLFSFDISYYGFASYNPENGTWSYTDNTTGMSTGFFEEGAE